MKLLFEAILKFICGFLLVGLLVFLPAGTLNYTDGWIFILLLFIPILTLGIVLFIKSPELLKKRLDGKEKQKTQSKVVAFSALIFILGFIISGLDFRFGWSSVPRLIKISAYLLFLLSYIIYAEVVRENAYLSRKIEVQENQRVVDTGLYGIIRHPMYAATILLFTMIPLILGSWLAFIIFLAYPVLIGIRIKNEEEILTKELVGYAEYKERVKYKIIPFLW